MPVAVKKVRWKCPQCGKSRWLKPHDARLRKFCSRPCQYAAARVAVPVRAKPSTPPVYSLKPCESCGQDYRPRTKTAKYCSRACQLVAIHVRRVDQTVTERPCENCGKVYRPRPGGAGRFCSRVCNFEGTKGSNAPNYRGGRHVTADGYVKVQAPGHPVAHGNGDYVSEHRLVMEQMLGRYLLPDENVHHINGVKDDNRPENLELWVRSQPPGQRVEDKVSYALEILRRYRPEALAS